MLIDNFLNYINTNGGIDPKVILDVGSRDLDQSIEFNSVYPNAKIHAFEPNPVQFEICKQKKVPYENISVHQYALGDIEGKVEFHLTLGNIGASSLLKPIDVPFASTQEVQKIGVQCIRLESFLKNNNIDNIDILWMDTQGVELLALMGMGEYLKKVKFLHCEAATAAYYEGHILKDKLDSYLMENGFQLHFSPSFHPYGEGDIFAINTNI